MYNVRSLSVKEKILEAAEKRNDKWGDEVKHRIMSVDDLVAADGIYHQLCFVSFFTHLSTGKKRGRPEVKDITTAMEQIYSYLENNDDCQVSLCELMSQCVGYVPSEATIKNKLNQKYGDNIIITQSKKKIPVVCFRDTGLKILSESWYNMKNKMNARNNFK